MTSLSEHEGDDDHQSNNSGDTPVTGEGFVLVKSSSMDNNNIGGDSSSGCGGGDNNREPEQMTNNVTSVRSLSPLPPSSQPKSRMFHEASSSPTHEREQQQQQFDNTGTATEQETFSSTSFLSSTASSLPTATSSFAQLAYRTFETYMNETRADQFREFQHIMPHHTMDYFCNGYVTGNGGSARITGGPMIGDYYGMTSSYHQGYYHSTTSASGGVGGHQSQPFEPIALRRHIHSTPLRHTPSIVDSSDDEDEPPPVGLEILNRSRSTPLSTSKNSAFGTILRTNSHSVYDSSSSFSDRGFHQNGSTGINNNGSNSSNAINNSSAFSSPPYPMLKSNSRSVERQVSRPVIFNPIKHHDDELASSSGKVIVVDGGEEMTSIEVTDVQHDGMSSNKSVEHNTDKRKQEKKNLQKKQSAAARAAKFLNDVRNLRISTGGGGNGSNNKVRKTTSSNNNDNIMNKSLRSRGGRENPAKPPSVSSDDSQKPGCSISGDEETLSSKSSSGTGISEKLDKITSGMLSNVANSESSLIEDKLKQLSEQTSKSKNTDESPINVPSPSYHRLEDSPGRDNKVAGLVCIQVNNNTIDNNADRQEERTSTPEPGHAVRRSLTPISHGSPESSRFSLSSNSLSSGQRTQGTSNSFSSSAHTTHLSAISETDREVENLNQGTGELRDEEEASAKADNIELSLLSGRNVQFVNYVELVDSPSPDTNLRDGASVQADRFFSVNGGSSTSSTEKRGFVRLRTLPASSKRSGSSVHSSTTVSSASVNTNSSSSSMGRDEPPKIVSYLDRKQVSDLTSLHNRGESNSSPRAGLDDRELRDCSPSDQILVEDSEVIFEGANAPKLGNTSRPRPVWPGKGLQFGRKIRSLPPRSPYKGLRAPTTPPPTSVSPAPCSSLSPPRQIVDHKVDHTDNNNLSRPYVLKPGHSRRQQPRYPTEATPSSSSSSASRIGYYAHIPGAGSDYGSHEVVRLSPSIGMASSSRSNVVGQHPQQQYFAPAAASVPRGLSPVGGHQHLMLGRTSPSTARAYEESSIEILKSDSKEDSNSVSPLPIISDRS